MTVSLRPRCTLERKAKLFVDLFQRCISGKVTHVLGYARQRNIYNTLDEHSLIEQWRSIMDCLTDIAAGSTLRHAMFMLQLLHDCYVKILKEKALEEKA